jgi:hypothetical protein
MGKYAIIIVLTVIISSSIYSYGLQRIWLSSDIAAVDIYNYSQARNIAQSAAMIAVRKIVTDEDASYIPSSGSQLNKPLSPNSFNNWPAMKGQYQLRMMNQGDTLLTVLSRGKFRDSVYDVEVILKKESDRWDPEFPHAVFALSSINMTGNSRISGHVGTNSTTTGSVTMTNASRIDSSLSIGPGANPALTVSSPGNVLGGIQNLKREMPYEMPQFPEFPAKLSTASNISITTNRITSYSSSYYDKKYIASITITSGGTAQFATDNVDRVLHVGNLDITQGHLNVSGTGTLTIYVENRLTLGSTSTINQTRSTVESLFVYYKGTTALNFEGRTGINGSLFVESADITLTGNSTLSGSGGVAGNIISGGKNVTISGNAASLARVIYAPDANFKITGSGVVRGSIVCKTFFSDGDGRVETPTNSPANKTHPEFPPLKKSGKLGFAVGYWR